MEKTLVHFICCVSRLILFCIAPQEGKLEFGGKAAKCKLAVMGLLVMKNANEFTAKCRFTAKPFFDPLVLIKHYKDLVGLIDRGSGVVHAVAIEPFVDDHDFLCPAVTLEPKTVILESGSRALIKSDAMLFDPGSLEDASPVLHANVEEIQVLLGV